MTRMIASAKSGAQNDGSNADSPVLRAAQERISREALAHMGEGHIAYVKQIRSEDVPHLYPDAPRLAPGIQLYTLHGADGRPLMLTDSRDAAIANAWSHDLETVSLH